jgi:hypothetical protein
MAYQVKTTKNYGNRLLDSLKGIIPGFIIFIVGTILLFWNEGNYVKNDKTIGEASRTLVKVSDVSSVDSSLDGKLIHAYAFADTQDVLADTAFGVSEKAIALSRKMEYYQYKEIARTETKDKLGGGQEKVATYTYEKAWMEYSVDSDKFHDPEYKKSNFVLENEAKHQTIYAKNVTFGAYKLPDFMINDINDYVPAEPKLNNIELAQWNNRITKRMTELGLKADSSAMMIQVQGNVVYLGKSSSNPQIGDVRITFNKVPPSDISIIAKVVGSSFEQYIAFNGRPFYGVEMGTVSAEGMIALKKLTNKVWTWVLRILGVILICSALWMIFNILPMLFQVLPPLAKIVGAGVGLICSVGGIAWSFLIISISWLFYRPLIGIPLLLVSVAGIWFLRKKIKEKKAARTANTSITAEGWKCDCGTVNKGKFCADCGKPKPAGVPQYKCDKCGWEPKDMAKIPKFCPDCGDPFDDGDIVK